MTPKIRPVVLIIRDGWGEEPETRGNAIAAADTPVHKGLFEQYPWTLIGAAGRDVGLPDGQMGNSEVGHLNMGAGRIVYQDLTRISKAIEDGTFFENEVLLGAVEHAKKNGSALHLMGLVSDGGVHSQDTHIYALLELAARNGLDRVFVHVLTDGRDTSPTGGAEYIRQLEAKAADIGAGRVASVCGRYWAMDRDNRWERVEEAYRAFTAGQGRTTRDVAGFLEECYQNDETDEFVKPTLVVGDDGEPVGLIRAEDSFIFFNFRADRAREITRAFVDRGFPHFERPDGLFPRYVCMTEYDVTIDAPAAFGPVELVNILGQVVSEASWRQLRIAETEKYAHVTFFFSGGVEEPVKGEDRSLIPSPKVATYDLQPEMSAYEVTDEVEKRIASGDYDLVVLNFANCDMVGHTGIFEAAVKAVETVDECVGRVVEATKSAGGALIVTADHGNAEKMIDFETGEPFTAHTTNKVHFILVDDSRKSARLREDGILADIAPTILEMMGLPQPPEMTGRSMILP
ncbi:MAG: 2,3-bisphosphoglycerate-independent phosphoglycerate mutase [Planctomycetes bacterium]|nr:2,3-bisphosphoglycerate-independent phosphoglycerate mutase [Planctomycetota bacterium]